MTHVPAKSRPQAGFFYERLQAPRKQWVWFEHSAHAAPFEEPEAFTRELVRIKAEMTPAVSGEESVDVNTFS